MPNTDWRSLMPTPVTPPASGSAIPGPAESTLCAAAALYLMSRYSQQPCPLVAHAIAAQLGILSRQCTDSPARALQSLALVLLPHWQRIASGQANTTVRH
jgi:hypothetical protein